MKKEILLVPSKKHPMDNLIDLVKKSPNSWIFLHDNMKESLEKEISAVSFDRSEFIWKEKGKLCIEGEHHPWCRTWVSVSVIQCEGVDYKKPSDPEDIYFLRMEK